MAKTDKDFLKQTQAAVNKFFSVIPETEDVEPLVTPIETQDEMEASQKSLFSAAAETSATRGKRDQRVTLLMDQKLRDELKILSRAMGKGSVNDLVVNILADYVDRPESRKVITAIEQVMIKS